VKTKLLTALVAVVLTLSACSMENIQAPKPPQTVPDTVTKTKPDTVTKTDTTVKHDTTVKVDTTVKHDTVTVPKVDSTVTILSANPSLKSGPANCASAPSFVLFFTNPLGLRVIWTTSNSLIAKVDSTGAVTAVGPGQATITVVLANKPTATDYRTVTVTDCTPAKPIVTVVIEQPSIPTFHIGTGCAAVQQYQVLWHILSNGVYASNQLVTFSSQQNGVMSVGASGLISPVKVGTDTITLNAVIDPTAFAKVAVTVDSQSCVAQSPSVYISILTPGGTTMHVLATQLVSATFKDASGAVVFPADPSGTWSSSLIQFADINPQSGLLTAYSAATNPPGASATSQICFTLGAKNNPTNAEPGCVTITVIP
jgi:hypothetical protein